MVAQKVAHADGRDIENQIREFIDQVFYYVASPDGVKHNIDEKYITVDGDYIGLNREAIIADDYEVPGLDNAAFVADDNYEVPNGILSADRPREVLYTTPFNANPTTRQYKVDLIELLSRGILRTRYGRNDKQIEKYLSDKMTRRIRPEVLHGPNQGQARAPTGKMKLMAQIKETTEAEGRGVNSELDLNEYVCAAFLKLHDDPNAVVTDDLPSSDDSLRVIFHTIRDPKYHLCATKEVTQDGCDEGVRLIMENTTREYLNICANVGKDLIVQNGGRNADGNELDEDARQNIINVRQHTGLNARVCVFGAALSVSVGQAILVRNKNGEGGDILVRLSGKETDDGEIKDPTCVGALLKKGWDANKFEAEGPYSPFSYKSGTYYMGLFTAHLYKVFREDELDPLAMINEGDDFRRNLVDLGNGYYITRLKVPKKQVEDGLPTYNYSLTGQGSVTAHQLMARIKREIGIDSRGWFTYQCLYDDGYFIEEDDGSFRVATPEEAFPIRRENTQSGSRSGIPGRLQSEVSDNEHHFREYLVDNNCLGVHDTNHSRNVLYMWVSSHEERGSGYTNYAHTIIEWEANSSGSTREYNAEYQEAHNHHDYDSPSDPESEEDESQG